MSTGSEKKKETRDKKKLAHTSLLENARVTRVLGGITVDTGVYAYEVFRKPRLRESTTRSERSAWIMHSAYGWVC